MSTKIQKFLSDDSGATALEYGLIAALIAVVIIVSVRALGSNLSNTFNIISTEIGNTNSTNQQ
jgi:pilus assembly protein Flp/PilA